jgi:hypothetical protein
MKIQIQNTIIALAGVVVLAACAGAPVGWGGTHEVVMANEKAITVLYDPFLGGHDDAYRIATEHCKKFGKDPVPTVEGRKNMQPTQTFECK